jgi:hypothetical protein
MSDITRERIESLMKRCQIGVGGKHAFDDAHDIMSDCYGTLGAMMIEIEELREWKSGVIAHFKYLWSKYAAIR